ncbi:hypothetical protein ES705_38268 [subsurface metagenome]
MILYLKFIKNVLRKLIKGKNFTPLYTNREERYAFIFKTFKKYIKNSVLDVGCSEGYLKDYLTDDIQYVGIDIEGEPDFIVDLEKDKLSMFKDKSFFLVICTEVLEHLDNLHEIFDELARVSEKYIIISLPNSWFLFKFPLFQGKSKINYKFYGLPKEKPPDRHKWFFNYDQALEFAKYRAEKNNYLIKTTFPTPIFHNNLITSIFDLIFRIYYRNNYGYNNLHYLNLWVLLERRKNL